MKTQINFKDFNEYVELDDVQDLDQLMDQISKYDICPDFFVVQYEDEEGDIIDVHDSVDFSLIPLHDSLIIVTKTHEGEGFHKKKGADKSQIVQGMSESQEDFQKNIMNHKMFWNSIEEITDKKIDLRLRQFKKELIQEFKLQTYEEQKEIQDSDDYYTIIELLNNLRELSKDMKVVTNEDVLKDIQKTHKLKYQKLQELNAQMERSWNADYSDALMRVRQSQQKK